MRKATPPGQHIQLVRRFVRFPYIARISRAVPPFHARESRIVTGGSSRERPCRRITTPASLGVLGDLRITRCVTNVARANILGTGATLCVGTGARKARRNMLKLRSIGIQDYSVFENKQRIGRIRFADEHAGRLAVERQFRKATTDG